MTGKMVWAAHSCAFARRRTAKEKVSVAHGCWDGSGKGQSCATASERKAEESEGKQVEWGGMEELKKA